MKEEKEQRQAVRHAAAPLTITNIHRGHLTQRHTSLTIEAAACSTRFILKDMEVSSMVDQIGQSE